MAKSKRAKVVHLTKTEKKGKDGKSKLIDQVRQAASTFKHTYIFRVKNMRNTLFKNLRTTLSGRFFIGKNKVMALALGLDESSECAPNISHLARRLKGDLGLLFTDEAPERVQQTLAAYQEEDYARTGNRASLGVIIEADAAGLRNVDTNEPLPATVEGQLRAAGMPTKLRGGTVLLAVDSYVVCKEREQLTADQARILKVFGIKMATFRVGLLAHYHDGTFEEYEVEDEDEDEEQQLGQDVREKVDDEPEN